MNTACYVSNRCLIKSLLNKTPYELLFNRKTRIDYFRPFGCKCFVLNSWKRELGKFDSKSDKVVFVGYFSTIKDYRVFN